MILKTAPEIKALLERAKTIAVVGASPNPARPSRGVFDALVAGGRYTRHAGQSDRRRYRRVSPRFRRSKRTPPSTAPPDIVDVFRNPADAPEVTREAIAAGAKAIWFQLGVVNEDAIAAADAAGLDVVVDRCIKIEIARLLR